MQLLNGRRHAVRELAFSHCGRWLAACGSNGGLHVWDTANPTAKPLFPLRTDHIGALAFRSDGKLFFHIRYGRWFLYDPITSDLSALEYEELCYIVASPDARHVVRVNTAPPIVTWGFTADEKPTQQLSLNCSAINVTTAAFTTDGTRFATVEWSWNPVKSSVAALVVRDTATGEPVAALPDATGSTAQVAFSASGERAFARWNATLACWSLTESDEPPRKVVSPSRRHFLAMAVHPQGPVLTVDNDRFVRVWGAPALTAERTIEWNVGKLYAVAVSPDGTRAAVGSGTGKVLVWDWD